MDRQEFEALWESSLKAKLSSLEVLRKKMLRANVLGILVFLIVGAALIARFGFHLYEGYLLSVGFASTLCGMATYFLLRPKHYRSLYKETVIASLIGATKYLWQYRPSPASKGLVSAFSFQKRPGDAAGESFQDMFVQSGLYRKDITMFSTDDTFISGKYPITTFEAQATSGSGKSRHVFFSGMLFRFDLHHAFAGETYIRNESGSIFTTPIGSAAASTFSFSNARVTTLEWNEFEKLLEVQTTDEREAREILDPQFMEILFEWWRVHGERYGVRISFKETHMYMAVPFGGGLFEPKPSSSIDKHKEELWQYLGMFLLAEALFDLLVHKYRLDLALAQMKNR